MENHFRPAALKWAHDHLKDWQLAEDVVQEAFLVAYQNIHQLHNPAAFPGWFKRIVHSQCHRIIRQSYRKIEVLEPEPGVCSPAPMSPDPVQNRIIASCLGRLPLQEHIAVQLFYWEGYTYQEMSQHLDVPVSTIKKRLYSARQKIKKMM